MRVYIYLNGVPIIIDLNLQPKNTHRPLVLISLRATLGIRARDSIFLLVILCHVHYHPRLVLVIRIKNAFIHPPNMEFSHELYFIVDIIQIVSLYLPRVH